jgi:hypothetical protein
VALRAITPFFLSFFLRALILQFAKHDPLLLFSFTLPFRCSARRKQLNDIS